jgi:hypothetical protein
MVTREHEIFFDCPFCHHAGIKGWKRYRIGYSVEPMGQVGHSTSVDFALTGYDNLAIQ